MLTLHVATAAVVLTLALFIAGTVGANPAASSSSDIDEVERELRALASLPSPKSPTSSEGAAASTSANGAHISGVSGSSGASGRQQRPSPPLPCLDLNPACAHWTTLGECTTSPDYMHANCPMSCNLCNPSLMSVKDAMAADGIILDGDHYADGPGVRQRLKFEEQDIFYNEIHRLTDGVGAELRFGAPKLPEDSPKRDKKKKNRKQHERPSPRKLNEGYEEKYEEQEDGYVENLDATAWAPDYVTGRVEEILDGMDIYLSKMAALEKKQSQQVAGSGAEKNDYSHEVIVPELCLNHHPNCAFWAARGYCDSSRLSMKEMCPVVCHVCRTYVPGMAKAGKMSNIRGLTPFDRYDLVGIFEALQEDRAVPPARLATYVYGEKLGVELKGEDDDRDSAENEKGGGGGGGSGKKDAMALLEAEETLADEKMAELREHFDVDGIDIYTKVMDKPERFSHLVTMRDFLSEGNCNALLELIKEQAKDRAERNKGDIAAHVEEVGEDGFPLKPTVDEVGIYKRERMSSRTYIDREKLPSLEGLLAKLEFVTGIPLLDRVEFPIRVEKFEEGHFQAASLHFGTSVNAPEPPVNNLDGHADEENLLLTYDYGIANKNKKGINKDTVAPRTMVNPRVFGVTIFLNDVPLDGGGEVVFPRIGKFTVEPEVGMAVLFPTVLSLMGEEQYTERQLSKESYETWHKLDKSFKGGDGTFLEEDFDSAMAHRKVTSGTKYVMQLYFRRYPHTEGMEERITWHRDPSMYENQ